MPTSSRGQERRHRPGGCGPSSPAMSGPAIAATTGWAICSAGVAKGRRADFEGGGSCGTSGMGRGPRARPPARTVSGGRPNPGQGRVRGMAAARGRSPAARPPAGPRAALREIIGGRAASSRRGSAEVVGAGRGVGPEGGSPLPGSRPGGAADVNGPDLGRPPPVDVRGGPPRRRASPAVGANHGNEKKLTKLEGPLVRPIFEDRRASRWL